MLKNRLAALACSGLLAIGAAYAQAAGGGGNNAGAPGNGNSPGNTNPAATNKASNPGAPPAGQGGTVAPGVGKNSAPVPQYWVADADIFIGNAAHTAQVMAAEQAISVQQPQIIGDQANFINNATARALADIRALNANAQATNPRAVPGLRDVDAQLVAAQAQARQLSDAAKNAQLGPTYQVTVTAALGHLRNALNALNEVARLYPGSTVTSTAFLGAYGANTGANAGAGATGGYGVNGTNRTGVNNGAGAGATGGTAGANRYGVYGSTTGNGRNGTAGANGSGANNGNNTGAGTGTGR